MQFCLEKEHERNDGESQQPCKIPENSSLGEHTISETTQMPLNTNQKDKETSSQKKKRKSNVEKSLEVVMKKFQESSTEEFKRWCILVVYIVPCISDYQ